MLRDVMPGWVGWLGPACFLGAFALWEALVPVSVLWQVRRDLRVETRWTKRAVLASEGRFAIVMGFVLWIPLAFGLPDFLVGSFSRVAVAILVSAGAALSVGVSVYAGWRFIRRDLRQPVPASGTYVGLLVRRWWPALAVVALGFLAPSRLTSW